MASMRDHRAVPMSAIIMRVVTLLSILQAVLLAVTAGGDLARSGLHGSVGLFETIDCVSPSHHDDPPPPACPRHKQCCVLGSVIASPPDLIRAFIFLRPEPGEADAVGPVAEEDLRGPDPSPPWSSRAPPFIA